ncbi:MAG: carboxypeptidase regulatory-like domain-containing protein [Armatimonadota bacterium]
MDCKTAERMMTSLADREPPGDEAERLREHVRACGSCNARHRQLSGLSELVGALEVPDPGEAYWRHVAVAIGGRVREEQGAGPLWALRQWASGVMTARRAVAAGGALLAVLLCIVVLNVTRQDVVADTLEAMAKVKAAHVMVNGQRIWLSREHGVRRDTKDGFVIYTAEGTWVYDREQNKMVVSDPAPAGTRKRLMALPGAIWLERLSQEHSPYKYTVSNDSFDDRPAKRIDVEPGPDGLAATLWIDRDCMRVVALREWRMARGAREATGPTARVDYRARVDREVIVPDPPEGVVVEDRRADASRRASAPAAAGKAQITGTVTDDRGWPIAGARVEARATGVASRHEAEARTDAAGSFAIHGLPPGEYRTEVRAPGHSYRSRSLRLGASTVRRLDVHLTRRSSVSGRIVQESGEPLADTDVVLSLVGPGGHQVGARARTGADGAYTALSLGTGVYGVVVKAPGYARTERVTIMLAPGRRVTGVNFVVREPSGSIAGVVYQADGKTPEADAVVWIRGAEREPGGRDVAPLEHGPISARPPWLDYTRRPPHVTTGRGGTFVLEDVAEGMYWVYAYAPGARTCVADEHAAVGRSEHVTGVNIVLAPPLSIRGTIYAADGQPLADAEVEAKLTERRGNGRGSRSMTIATDERGRYSIEPLQPGDYELELRPDGAARATQAVEVADGQRASVADFRLAKGPTLAVLIVGPDGQPSADVPARLWKEPTRPRASFPERIGTQATDGEGRVRFEHLPEGTYWVTAASPTAAPARGGPVAVSADRPDSELRIDLPEGATINGRLVDQYGNLVPGAEVRAQWSAPRPGPKMTTTLYLTADEQGRFVVRHAALGHWSFWAKAPGHVTEYRSFHVSNEGEHDVEVVPVKAWSGRLEAQICMPDGKTPVADTDFALYLFADHRGTQWRQGVEDIRTDAEGRFSVPVDTGIHAVTFAAKDLSPTRIDIEPSDRQALRLTVTLPPVSGIRGRFQPADAEIPADGLYVFAVGPGGRVRLPDEEEPGPNPGGGYAKVTPGQREWEIVGLAPGEHELFTYAEGFAPSVPLKVQVTEGQMAQADVPLPPSPGAVSGRVVTADGVALQHVSVSARTSGGRIAGVLPSARTDEQGRYRIDGLTPGPVRIQISIASPVLRYARPPEASTMVVSDQTTQSTDIEMHVGGEVRGTVKRRDGKPLRGRYSASLRNGPAFAGHGVRSDGLLVVEHVYPGTYDLHLQRYEWGESKLIAKREGITVADEETVAGIEFVIDE